MFSIVVRDHVMIAHSFRGEVFGPAQRLHGATYVVDVEFFARELDEDGLVIDIGLAKDALRALLAELDYRNLDELDAFKGKNTTTEYLCQFVFERLRIANQSGALAKPGRIDQMRVTFRESHVAWASYEERLSKPS
ncbi:MAG TPA: 6-carboxytetrahydropterin synthase [Polyangiales bacterium]|jgi:6-pyruvoyl-tetrahydropterin synthase|nr:6-carboxytetrahydropterin synthase [Polyangiales bacterium]